MITPESLKDYIKCIVILIGLILIIVLVVSVLKQCTPEVEDLSYLIVKEYKT